MAEAPRTAHTPSFEALRWRRIGPPRGGRVVAVAGDPVDPMCFYLGACPGGGWKPLDGGLWKTLDGGVSWSNVSPGFFAFVTISALAVAPSDSNLIYAGTGETHSFISRPYGDGVYRSRDAGRSWQQVGPSATIHIGRICVHPQDPDLVYVAAMGDRGRDDERGVYRSRDAGGCWQRVLNSGPDAGAGDLAMDPLNPNILYAACWQRRIFRQAYLGSRGYGGGLFRSMDGGDTWVELTASGTTDSGLPRQPLGKLGVAASGARAGRVWALVQAEGDKAGLYRSDDHGEHWVQVRPSPDPLRQPWHHTHVFADSGHADTVYITNLQMWKSTDGGRQFEELSMPRGDNHDMWIDPKNPQRMIVGNDGGACVSFDAGCRWSSIYDQHPPRFYRLDVNTQHPYRVFGALPDKTSISVASASEWGGITNGDFKSIRTYEGGYIAVHPQDPNIIYCGAVGASPGIAVVLQSVNRRLNQLGRRNIRSENATGIEPWDLKYRFAWTFPLAFAPSDPNTIYAGGNCVFRTRDGGVNWTAISPDLSVNDPARKVHSGGHLTLDAAVAEVHGTCACLAPSPHRAGEIWASTDDGLVHVTRDDGQRWLNVTPQALPELACVDCVEISAHAADTVYVSATHFKLTDHKPYLFRSCDGGEGWQAIHGDLPPSGMTHVIRADPVRAGLLFVGTETGIFYSLDDGSHWQRLPGGLPTEPVYELKIKGADLVASTHGCSFWILDDISPLRTLSTGLDAVQLVPPRDTVLPRLASSEGLGNAGQGVSASPNFGIGSSSKPVLQAEASNRHRFLDDSENPPKGALLYYWLPTGFKGLLELEVKDSIGRTVRAWANDDRTMVEAMRPPARSGLNRFVWDLHQRGSTHSDNSLVLRHNQPPAAEGDDNLGPLVAPGRYWLLLRADGVQREAEFAVLSDPRVTISQHEIVTRTRKLRPQLRAWETRLAGTATALQHSCDSLLRALRSIEMQLWDLEGESLRVLSFLDDVLGHPGSMASIRDDIAVAKPARQVSAQTLDQLDAQWDRLVSNNLDGFNKALARAGLPPVQI